MTALILVASLAIIALGVRADLKSGTTTECVPW